MPILTLSEEVVWISKSNNTVCLFRKDHLPTDYRLGKRYGMSGGVFTGRLDLADQGFSVRFYDNGDIKVSNPKIHGGTPLVLLNLGERSIGPMVSSGELAGGIGQGYAPVFFGDELRMLSTASEKYRALKSLTLNRLLSETQKPCLKYTPGHCYYHPKLDNYFWYLGQFGTDKKYFFLSHPRETPAEFLRGEYKYKSGESLYLTEYCNSIISVSRKSKMFDVGKNGLDVPTDHNALLLQLLSGESAYWTIWMILDMFPLELSEEVKAKLQDIIYRNILLLACSFRYSDGLTSEDLIQLTSLPLLPVKAILGYIGVDPDQEVARAKTEKSKIDFDSPSIYLDYPELFNSRFEVFPEIRAIPSEVYEKFPGPLADVVVQMLTLVATDYIQFKSIAYSSFISGGSGTYDVTIKAGDILRFCDKDQIDELTKEMIKVKFGSIRVHDVKIESNFGKNETTERI